MFDGVQRVISEAAGQDLFTLLERHLTRSVGEIFACVKRLKVEAARRVAELDRRDASIGALQDCGMSNAEVRSRRRVAEMAVKLPEAGALLQTALDAVTSVPPGRGGQRRDVGPEPGLGLPPAPCAAPRGQVLAGAGGVGVAGALPRGRSGGLTGPSDEMPQATFLFTLKSPMRFSVSNRLSRGAFHLLDVRYPQVHRTQPLGANRTLARG